MAVADPLVMPLVLELLECYETELAKLEVPNGGVNSAPVSDVEIMQNLDEKKPAAAKKAAPKS